MPSYLDNNIYSGAGNAASQMGDAFTRAIVGTQALRYQQAQLQQQQAMEAARLEMERQRLLAEIPRIGAETEGLKATTALNKGKLSDLQTGAKAGGILGDVMKGIGETDMTKNPETMRMLQAIAAQQQAVLASQNPQNIARQSADIQLGMTPEGRKFVSAGYQPATSARQYPSPQQAAALQLGEMMLAAKLKGRKGDFGADVPPDEGEASDFANALIRSIYSGGEGMTPSVPTVEEPAPAPKPVAPTPAPQAPSEGILGILKRTLLGGAPPQAAAPAQAPAAQPQVAPPQARPVGTRVTTAKGNFIWDGQSWQPAPAQ